MDHHQHQHENKNILLAFALNACFSIIELIGGYLTNSVAIYSDALHDFGDSLGLLFAYFTEKLSQRGADSKFTFGYKRFSLLSALVNGLILLTGSFYVIYEAVVRIANPEPVKAEGMFALAILGIIVNSYAAYKLSKNEGMNSKMVTYHLLEDILGWVAVLIVSVVLFFKPWYVLDSILSILISLIILRGVYKNLFKIGLIFLQKFPGDIRINEIKKTITKLDLVEDIHAIQGWSIDESTAVLSFHVVVPLNTTIVQIDELKEEIKKILLIYEVHQSSIEFESERC